MTLPKHCSARARIALYTYWNFFFARLPNVALYELSELIQHLSKKESKDAWLKIKKVFSERFGCGPMINRSIVLALAPDGSHFYCPIVHSRELLDEIYRDQVYDRFFEPDEGSKVVDVGAHVGAYTLRAARKVGKNGIVVSVEPDPYTYRLLVTNVKMNGFDRVVIPINIALASFVGKARLYISSKDRCGNSLVPSGQESVEVSVNTLDELMKDLDLEHCDLLKVDVEGYELEVLKGAQNTLKNTSKVVVAAYHEWVFKGEEEAVKNYLKSQGFCKVFSKSSMVYALK